MRNGKLMTKRLVAIALSSMMAMSMGMTAFAAQPYDDKRGDVFGKDEIQTESENYLDEITTVTRSETYAGTDYSKESYTSAKFKKTLTLENLLNTDYIPTVPDINFQYTIEPATMQGGVETLQMPGIKDGVKTTIPVLVHSGVDGVINAGAGDKTEVVFTGADDPTTDNDDRDDVMTKYGTFTLDDTNLQGKDSGIYRYYITESAAAMNDGTLTNILASVEDYVNTTHANGGEVSKKRIIDVVVSKVSADPNSDLRAITGIILRDADKESDAYWVDTEQKIEGYTEHNRSYSKYTTYDLVIGKEITGTGLNDINKSDEFSFTVTFDVNDKCEVEVVKSTAANKASVATFDTTNSVWVGKDGKGISQTFTIKGNERIQVSGLPLGVSYTLVEAANDYTANIVKTNIAALKHDADGDARKFISIADADNKDFTAKVVGAAGGTDIKKMTAEEAAAATKTAIKKLAKGDDIQNVFIVNRLDPVTITGVVMNVAPYALMVIAAAIFAGLFISKKRQEEEI